MSISVLLVDDHPVFRAGLRVLLDTSDDITIAGEACDGEEAIEMVKQLMPDVVVMDISMPNINGIEATKEIIARFPDTKILALSIHAGKHFVKDMLAAGAKGYLLKDSAPDELITAIQKMIHGEMYLSSSITKVALEKDDAESDLTEGILNTKLNRPPITNEFIIRQNIIDQLESNLDKPLSLVSAPAGYGKSILASQWMENTSALHAWVSLDEEHNDLRVFLIYLNAAIKKIFPYSLNNLSGLLRASEMPSLKVLTTTLINELDQLGDAFILVLDDYHNIRNDIIHQLINEVLRFPPENMHLALLARHDPPLSLNALRTHNRISEIRMQDLAFGTKEIISLFKLLIGLTIQDKTAQVLQERTEGWIVGLRLASMSVKDQNDKEAVLGLMKENVSLVYEFLIEEVLLSQAPDIQQLLLKSSILDRFSASLIDALISVKSVDVASSVNGEEYIQHLIKDNLFIIPLDTEHKWFRYHHLFRDLLSKKLKQVSDEKEYKEINAEAGNWYEKNKLVSAAIDHYILAGDIPSAVKLIEKSAHEEFILGVYNVETWLKKLPADTIENNPTLLLIEAWHAFGQFHLEKIPPILERVENLLKGKKPSPAQLAEISFFQGNFLYWMGDTENSISILSKSNNADAKLPMHVKCNIELILNMARQRSGDYESLVKELQHLLEKTDHNWQYYIAYVYGSLAFVHILSGRLIQARAVAHQMQIHTTKIKSTYLLSWSLYIQGLSNLYMFNLKDALHQFSDAADKRYYLDLRAIIDAMAAKALVLYFNNEHALSLQAVDAVMNFAGEVNDPQSVVVAKSVKARIDLLMGNLDAAMEWAISFEEPVNYPGLFFWEEIPWITKAKILLAEGSENSLLLARQLLNELLELVESSHLTYHLIEIKTLVSIACEDKEEALSKLEETIKLGASLGFISPFIESIKYLKPLLISLQAKGIEPDFINKIFELASRLLLPDQIAIEGSKQILPTEKQKNPAVELSTRENDILQELAKGLRNKEIAEKLYVSTDTVKKHLYNIFQKLEVKNRLELVNKAKEMGLVD